MRRISWGSCHLECAEWVADVHYDILIDPIYNGHDLLCEDYGARIELLPESGSPEIVELHGITPFMSVIRPFIDSLCRNGVTPATARDVLEDYLAILE